MQKHGRENRADTRRSLESAKEPPLLSTLWLVWLISMTFG